MKTALMGTIVQALAGAAAAAPAGPMGACAHRGDVRHAPENTLPAFRSAVEKGAHMIEFDVAATRDGKLVLMHDATVDRTTDGKGRVDALSFDEIRALDAGAWFGPDFAGTRVPTLTEALAVIPETILCNVHLRGGPEVGAACALVLQRLGRLEHCFLACGAAQAAAARAAVPGVRLCNMDRQDGDRDAYITRTLESGARFIQLLRGEECLAEAAARCREGGALVNYFGAEEPETIRRLYRAGVNYVLTDDLDACLAVLREDFGVAPAAPPDDETAVRAAVGQYFYGILHYDEPLLRQTFHPEASVTGIRKDGRLDHHRFDDWVTYTRGAAPDPAGRENTIAQVDLSGPAAVVKTELRWPGTHYTDYLSLLQVEGRWRIVNKIWRARAPQP